METSIKNVYAIGDGALGASIIVKAIANAKLVSTVISSKSFASNELPNETIENIYKDRAILKDGVVANACGAKFVGVNACEAKDVGANTCGAKDVVANTCGVKFVGAKHCEPDNRCLHCNKVCETCNEVCPNRANVHIILKDGSHQVVHVDSMCNECGNCEVFCPFDSKPYKDKFTLFFDENAMNDSTNDGFYYEDDKTAVVRIQNSKTEYKLGTADAKLGKLAEVIDTIKEKHNYMVF